jgi:hypothetical protein
MIDTTHPGFDDHHQMRRSDKPAAPLDPHKQAPKEIKDTVWEIVQGRAPTAQDDPDTVTVPKEYVRAVAWHATKELKRRGCLKGFSVKVDPDVPQVFITWERPSGLVTSEGNAYQGATDCLTAFAQNRPPEHVGWEAVDAFITRLEASLNP